MTALRWLLVLPVAVLGGLIAQLLTILVTVFIPYDEVSQTVSSATVPMGIVLLGARAAPSYKIQVAGALVLLSVLFGGMTLGWLVLGVGNYSPIVAALSVPLWLVGSVVALYVVYRQERRVLGVLASGGDLMRTNSGDKALVLNFLTVLEWASARQQLALEAWNDALAAQATKPMGGDEIFSPPLVEINEAYTARLLPVAEDRLASALMIRCEFAKLETAEMLDTLLAAKLDSLLLAIDGWSRSFEVHARRCEKTVRDLRALIAGTRSADNDEERRLKSQESETMEQAVAAQHAVMKQWGISFAALQDMIFSACNDLRVEIGKPKLSMTEYKALYSRGMAGERPRYYA